MSEFATKTAEQLLGALQMAKAVPLPQEMEREAIAFGYTVQAINLRSRLELGSSLAGWKIALTNQGGQDRFGVSEPAYGSLLHEMRVEESREISLSKLVKPKLEGEIAFILSEDVTAEHRSDEQILDSVSQIAPAFEIADSRIANGPGNVASLVADNAAAALYCLGEKRPFYWHECKDVDCDLYINEEHHCTGSTNFVLCGPAGSFVWLIRTLLKAGVEIKAGQVILTGTLFNPVEVAAGDTAVLEMLGSSTRLRFIR